MGPEKPDPIRRYAKSLAKNSEMRIDKDSRVRRTRNRNPPFQIPAHSIDLVGLLCPHPDPLSISILMHRSKEGDKMISKYCLKLLENFGVKKYLSYIPHP